jgi:hypothetical protein
VDTRLEDIIHKKENNLFHLIVTMYISIKILLEIKDTGKWVCLCHHLRSRSDETENSSLWGIGVWHLYRSSSCSSLPSKLNNNIPFYSSVYSTPSPSIAQKLYLRGNFSVIETPPCLTAISADNLPPTSQFTHTAIELTRSNFGAQSLAILS